MQERKKDLVDHREDSTFSFDPSHINVKKLSKHKLKKIDARKGVLLASYTRKKTRRRKRPKNASTKETSSTASAPKYSPEEKSSPILNKQRRSVTPSPSPSPRHGSPRSQPISLALPTKQVQLDESKTQDTLYPSNRLGI